MNIKNILFEMSHSNKGMQYIPVKELDNENYKQLIESYGLNINYFYKVTNRLYPFCYKKGLVFIEIYEMSKACFDMININKMISTRESMYNNLIEQEQFIILFGYIDKPFRIEYFQKLYNIIPNNQKYDVFMNIYTSSEYGFGSIPRSLIEDVIKYKPNNDNIDLLEGDEIIIYRGEGSLSTPYMDAYSWTTDESVARWFAKRFDSCGTIYKAKIKKCDIIEYVARSNEHEIIAFSENIYEIEKIL